MKAFIESQFSYCPLIWMFHSQQVNNRIYKLHERALRLVFNDHFSSFEQLLQRDNSFSIHDRNLQTLATEMYKVKHNLSPSFMHSIFPSMNIRNNHHHSFNVSFPLKVGRTASMFVLSFFLHSILFAGSALDSSQCLRSLLIVSFHVFFGLPRPRCPTTSNSVMLLIQPSFLTTCPNQRSRLYRNKVCMLLIPSFLRRESELMWSFKRTLHVHRIIARSLRCSLSRSLTLGAEHSLAYNKTVQIYVLHICPRVMYYPEFKTENIHTTYSGFETLTFRGPKTWDLVPKGIKESSNLDEFKRKINLWKPEGCVCRMYRVYINNLEFI